MSTGLLVVALVGGSMAVLAGAPEVPGSTLVQPGDLYWWYRPAGQQCPIYPFDPDDEDSRTYARDLCREENDTYFCTYAYGTAYPAC